MNEAKDKVWREIRSELGRRRARRRVLRSSVVAALALAGAWWGRGLLPPPPAVPVAVAESAPPLPVREDPACRLAVLVNDDLGMRLELVDAAEMADTELSLSLEPVVWNGRHW